jgi:hypothetical protein
MYFKVEIVKGHASQVKNINQDIKRFEADETVYICVKKRFFLTLS